MSDNITAALIGAAASVLVCVLQIRQSAKQQNEDDSSRQIPNEHQPRKRKRR